jgi:membrane protease YdiL (CAAX protease family)
VTPAPATAVLIFVGFGIVATGTYAWLIVSAKATLSWQLIRGPLAASIESLLQSLGLSPRLPLVPWTPRPPVPWGLIDLVAIVVLQLIAGTLLHEFKLLPDGKIEDLTLPQKQTVIAWNVGLSLLLAVVSVLLMMIRARATSHDLGWSWANIADDIRLGFIGFVMLAPPVYALQGVLVSLWKESKHPIVEMLKAAPDAGFFGVLVVSAAIIAPVFEELMFRVLLQGFLEKVCSFSGPIHELFLGAPTPHTNRPTNDPVDSLVNHLQPDTNRYASPQFAAPSTEHLPTAPADQQPELHGQAAWLPIAISSMIFALLHYSHGPDWIPLLFLAAGMGHLYQRTHRLLPSLIVHSLLNSLSMWGLWVAVKEGALTP